MRTCRDTTVIYTTCTTNIARPSVILRLMKVISAVRLTSIFCARREGLKLDLITTFTSSLVRPTSRTNGMTRKGRMMSLVVRYLRQSHCHCVLADVCHTADIHAHTLFTDLMSSYSPSGGMKLILRSESNLLRRTHWWNVQSSIAMDCFPLQQGTQRRETQQ